MRRTRIQTFKTNKKLRLLINIAAICYLVFFTLSIITSSTSAYYMDANKDNFSLQAGEWWDGSDLRFANNPTATIKACPESVISVKIKNDGFSMIGSTSYEIYYHESGNPKESGTLKEEGKIDPIKANGTFNLDYQANETGSYIFKVKQRPGYNDDYEKAHETWSDIVTFDCEVDEVKEEQEEDDTEEKENKAEETTEEDATENETDETPDTEVKEKEEESKSEETEVPKEETEEPATSNKEEVSKDTGKSSEDKPVEKPADDSTKEKNEEVNQKSAPEEQVTKQQAEETEEAKEETANEKNK